MNAIDSFQTPALTRICSTFVTPYLVTPYREIATDLLLLLDQEGEILSSVCDSACEHEPDCWLKPHASGLLKQVSLAEHIARVVEEAARIIPPATLILYRPLVIAALGSDIGKLSGAPNIYDYHPLASAAMVSRIIEGRLGATERNAIITAIWAHHVDTVDSDQISTALRLAHIRARLAELDGISLDLKTLARAWREIPLLPFQEKQENSLVPPTTRPAGCVHQDSSEINLGWMDVGRFIEKLSALVDRCKPGDFAISVRKGNIYFAPHTFYRAFRRYALACGWSGVLLYDSHPYERQRLLKSLVGTLHNANVIVGDYPTKGWFAKVHVVQYRDGSHSIMPLISFWVGAFPMTVDRLAMPKPKWLAKVDKIWPLKA